MGSEVWITGLAIPIILYILDRLYRSREHVANAIDYFIEGEQHFRRSVDGDIEQIHESVTCLKKSIHRKLSKEYRVKALRMLADCYERLGWDEERLEALLHLNKLCPKDELVMSWICDIQDALKSTRQRLSVSQDEQEIPIED